MSRPNGSQNPASYTISQASSPEDLTAIKSLFTAYAASLSSIDLSYQNFDAEVATLPGLYAEDTGCLLLARNWEGLPIGCVALRPLKRSPKVEEGLEGSTRTGVSEMKRLYCVPALRGMGLGRALVGEVISRAMSLAYEEIVLDTLSDMEDARKMYDKFGFVEVEAYYPSPVPGTIYLSKRLK